MLQKCYKYVIMVQISEIIEYNKIIKIKFKNSKIISLYSEK